MIPLVQISPPILNNILDKHWSETQIKGHHPGESELLFELLHKSGLMVQLLSKSTWCHNYLFLPSNMTSLVIYKGGKYFARSSITHRFCDHISLQSIKTFFSIEIFCSVIWPGETSTSMRCYRGAPWLLMWEVWFIMIIKWTSYYDITLKLTLCLRTEKLIQF